MFIATSQALNSYRRAAFVQSDSEILILDTDDGIVEKYSLLEAKRLSASIPIEGLAFAQNAVYSRPFSEFLNYHMFVRTSTHGTYQFCIGGNCAVFFSFVRSSGFMMCADNGKKLAEFTMDGGINHINNFDFAWGEKVNKYYVVTLLFTINARRTDDFSFDKQFFTIRLVTDWDKVLGVLDSWSSIGIVKEEITSEVTLNRGLRSRLMLMCRRIEGD